MHDRIALHLDGQAEDILQLLEQAGDLDGEPAIAGVQRAGRDEPVRAADDLGDLAAVQAVALDQQRVDDDFDDLLAVAGDVDLQHGRDALDLVAQVAGKADQRALRHLAGQGHHQNREQAEIDFVDRRLVGLFRQIGLYPIDCLADILQRGVDIEAGIEFQEDVADAFEGGAAHLLHALDAAQLLFHRPHHQPLGILRRDSVQVQRDIDDGDVDVGIGFLGDPDIGRGAADQQQQQGRDDRARPVDRGVDQRIHEASPPTTMSSTETGSTCCPA